MSFIIWACSGADLHAMLMCNVKVSCVRGVKRWSAAAGLIKDQMDLLLGRVYLGQWNYHRKCLDIIPQLLIRWENTRQRSLWSISGHMMDRNHPGLVWASSIAARCDLQWEMREFILRSLTWDCRFWCVGRSELSLRRCWDLFWNTKHVRLLWGGKQIKQKSQFAVHLNNFIPF